MLLTNENQETLLRLKELIPNCVRVDIVAGFMSSQGFGLLADSFRECLKSGASVNIIVGRLFDGDDYTECVKMMGTWPTQLSVHVSNMPDRLLHGKVYLLQQPVQSILIMGSANLTYGGLWANEELNTELPIASADLEQLNNYIGFLKRYAITLGDALGEAIREEERLMSHIDTTPRLGREPAARVRRFASACMGWVTQNHIDEWYHEIDEMSRDFRSVLNPAVFASGEWTGERFKTEFLMQYVWAVTEAKHTDLWPIIRKTSGDRIVTKLLDMLSAVDQGKEPDEVITRGRIPHVIGESIASEILHKCHPNRYAIKNKRSHWGMAFILDQGDGPSFPESMSYSVFHKYVDLIVDEFIAWLSERGPKVESHYRYYICDRFFLYIIEDEANSACMAMYYKGRKDDRSWM